MTYSAIKIVSDINQCVIFFYVYECDIFINLFAGPSVPSTQMWKRWEEPILCEVEGPPA